MKIIEPSATLIDEINPTEILRKLEVCGRVSHQSEPREDSPEKFVRKIIEDGHESVLEHVSLTFHIICDRAIQNELVRHRHASFTVESTRYVKYKELQIINPPINPTAILDAELAYKKLIKLGTPPEEARQVLPQCVKSELYMTANLREWRHILKLRTAKFAHPQMRKLAGQILDVFKEKLPVIVEDINIDD